jgi:hypothetical protein
MIVWICGYVEEILADPFAVFIMEKERRRIGYRLSVCHPAA